MNRKDFLKTTGVFGLSSLMMPVLLNCENAADHGNNQISGEGRCVVIPKETAGPFVMDLSKTPGFFRQDITEGMPGLPLNLMLRVTNVNKNCSPLSNARVDLWHCDKEGIYSGFVNQQHGADTTGKTFFRGIQLTDNTGIVKFKTVYPGWYPGRVTHIHLQVFLNDGLAATAQMAFPDDITAKVYGSSLYSARGLNTTVPNNSADGVFRFPEGALQYEICSISENSDTGGYDASFEVGIAV